jgi:hypothetical protein
VMLLALLVGTAVPVAEADIVVLARKLQLIEVDMKVPRRKGVLVMERCRITKSSGIAELDAVPCAVAVQCMTEAPDTRKQIERCVEARSRARLDMIAERRQAERELSS